MPEPKGRANPKADPGSRQIFHPKTLLTKVMAHLGQPFYHALVLVQLVPEWTEYPLTAQAMHEANPASHAALAMIHPPIPEERSGRLVSLMAAAKLDSPRLVLVPMAMLDCSTSSFFEPDCLNQADRFVAENRKLSPPPPASSGLSQNPSKPRRASHSEACSEYPSEPRRTGLVQPPDSSPA